METKHNSSEYQRFYSEIIAWYRDNPRDLPWRETKNPYKIWLSEIILQQTRVAQGLPYYNKFIEAYPTVEKLAIASEEEVLRLWQGLGYYSRARNLHFCAKQIWFEMDGNFPQSYKELLKLKGVGTYTASAISSFAFGEVKAVVDGNVFRVLARYFGIETDIASSKAKVQFEALANEIIPPKTPGEFNQAMMDFGARQCVPKSPNCSICPLVSNCFAFSKGLINALPVKLKKTKVRERKLHYYVIKCGEQWVWKKRNSGDIWEGLFDFPLLENQNPNPYFSEDLKALNLKIDMPPEKEYRHLLSHQRLLAKFSEIKIPLENQEKLNYWCDQKGFMLVKEEEIDYLAKPKLILNYLKDQGI